MLANCGGALAIDISELRSECTRLRKAQAETLALVSQSEVVELIAQWASQWRDPGNSFRREAQSLSGPFSWEMVAYSLIPLVESLTTEKLRELIDSEDVKEVVGPALLGHVIAANTPLLSWVSLLRGMLMRSASVVKVPSGPAAVWAEIFHRSLAAISPVLARTISLVRWRGGTDTLDSCFCQSVDTLLAYGSDATISQLRRNCPDSTVFVGYGHRVSIGLMRHDADRAMAAAGFARDIFIYDQGGCLSAQTIFAEGDYEAARSFGPVLAAALANTVANFPQGPRSAVEAVRVREARGLAQMAQNSAVWGDETLRWTVIAQPGDTFAASPGHGIVSIQPLTSLQTLPNALRPISGCLQGCAIAAPDPEHFMEAAGALSALGASRLCPPGDLQRPPFSWREDGRDLLRSLLPSGIENH